LGVLNRGWVDVFHATSTAYQLIDVTGPSSPEARRSSVVRIGAQKTRPALDAGRALRRWL